MSVTTRAPARGKILNAAWKLMLAKGYNATSVDEICEAAELTKGSFFHYFDSKEDLAKAVMNHHGASTQAVMDKGSFAKLEDPLQRLYGYLDYLAVLSKDPRVPRSCLFGNLSQELSSTHPQIRAACARAFAQWADALSRDLEAAKRLHAPGVEFDSKSVAEQLIIVYEGALILAKAKQRPQIIDQSIRHFKRYVEGLFEEARSKSYRRKRGRST